MDMEHHKHTCSYSELFKKNAGNVPKAQLCHICVIKCKRVNIVLCQEIHRTTQLTAGIVRLILWLLATVFTIIIKLFTLDIIFFFLIYFGIATLLH